MGNGAIYLCGRADGAPDRHFTGSVAHLALYNEALTPLQIRMIYTQACRPRLFSQVTGCVAFGEWLVLSAGVRLVQQLKQLEVVGRDVWAH